MNRLLAIDYGTKRIGVAISDPMQILGMPYCTIVNSTIDEVNREIVDICTEEGVERILVGFPISIDGNETEMTKKIDWFISQLEKNISIPIERCDERYTSAEAKAVMHKLGKTKKRKMKSERSKGTVDQMAAALLLKDWISDNV